MNLVDDAWKRLLIAVIVALAAGFAGSSATAPLGLLIGVGAAGLVFVVLGWIVLWPMDAGATESHVNDEDLKPHLDELVVVVATLAGLGAIGAVLFTSHSDVRQLSAALAAVGVFLMWASLHLIYTTRYAHLYYAEGASGEGIDFNQGEQYRPSFRDFFYFAYNLGMTYQVSDTNVQDRRIRSVVLRHCLLSYLFGTAILATMINLVVGVLG